MASCRGALAAALALVVGVGCGSGSNSSSKDDETTPTPEPPIAVTQADAATDVVSQATYAADDQPGPIQTQIVSGRSLEPAKPLRGIKAQGAPVFVARGNDAAAMIRRSLDGIKAWIPRKARVIVKINLGGHDNHGMKGRITDPAFTRALLLELRRRGVSDMAVADGASLDAKAMVREVSKSGYRAMLDELGVPFVNLNHYGDGDERPGPWAMKLPWAKHLKTGLILSHELVNPKKRIFLIDVPKIKAHRYAVMTVSIKNLMGAVMMANPTGTQPPWKRRWKMHGELGAWMRGRRKTKTDDRALYKKSLRDFSERLADLYGALTPDLVILEGMPASQGDGFKHAIPYGGKGIVIASKNGCYADYLAAEFFGLHDSDELEKTLGMRMPPAISAVADRYYGGVKQLKKIVVLGDTAWRTATRKAAWLKGLAPFQIGTKPR